MNREKQELLQALIEKPSRYEITVVDNSMLPADLKKENTISFTVCPPSLEVLAKVALSMLSIGEDIKELTLEKAVKHRRVLAEIFSILAHGKTTEIPHWNVPFILKNVTPKELFYLIQETALKTQSDFFLNSFQLASQMSPMMINKN